MLLHRYAMMMFPIALPAVERWGYITNEGVGVYVNSAQQGAEFLEGTSSTTSGVTFAAPQVLPVQAPTSILLHAEIATEYAAVDPAQIRISDAPRESAERALSEMAAILGILAETQWDLVSPRPYLMLAAENDDEHSLLERTRRIILPSWKVAPPRHGLGLGRSLDIAALIPDRKDGVLLLGAAQRAGHGIGKLHELFRVFENAFGCAGGTLVGPLSSFLSTYPWDLGYSRAEVIYWVNDLRHPGTHADLKKSNRIAHDSDVERHLFRIEQAAYDVLFNKTTWNRSDAGRSMRWAFSAAQDKNGGTIVSDNPTLRTDQEFDHYGTFPLYQRIRLGVDNLPEGWLPGDWHFSEQDWERFKGAADQPAPP